jgi:hypothetical protein
MSDVCDTPWVQDQVRFWYGENVNDILDRVDVDIDERWEALAGMIFTCNYGKHVSELLCIHDTTSDAVAKKYGQHGAYRFKENAKVLTDWVRHDPDHRLTESHRFPITLVDCIGPYTPVIGYNRVVTRAYAILWPLEYHFNGSLKGLTDTQSFESKIDKVAFRGALSGPCVSDLGRNKSSRVDVVFRWKQEPWADLGISLVPKDVAERQEYRDNETRIHACLADHMPFERIMEHKYVLCVEGADISSGFGWALASNCVPIHPYPFAFEVWFFNGLKPWVHFLPIGIDGQGLDTIYDWCQEHPGQCAEIARNGRSHMSKMLDVKSVAEVKTKVVARWDMRQQHLIVRNSEPER